MGDELKNILGAKTPFTTITPRVVFLAFSVFERLTHHSPLLRQQIGIGIAKMSQQLGRAFDISEEEGDGANR